MGEHDREAGAERRHGETETGGHRNVHVVARETQREDRTSGCTEHGSGRHPRIGAADDCNRGPVLKRIFGRAKEITLG